MTAGDRHWSYEADVATRLRHGVKTARMWGSPSELEVSAQHLTHVWMRSRCSAWSFERTAQLWKEAGMPFSADPQEHAAMRHAMWGDDEERARFQVVSGFTCVWAALDRHPEREPFVGPWVESLLDAPALGGLPDQLNIVLFTLMGFLARDPEQFVRLLKLERARIGGHDLRALHVVAQQGPSEAGLTYTRKFTSWSAVQLGVEKMIAVIEQTANPPRCET